jgi:RimJ/RimL family protein N-acetyltransferase
MFKNMESSGQWGDHFLHLAIDRNGELVGDIQLRHCEFSMPPGVAEIGVEVASELQGQGIGTRSLQLAAQFLFDSGYYRIVGSTAFNNFGMQRAFEKAGWLREGVSHNLFVERGVGIDYIVYAITNLPSIEKRS